MTAMAAGSLHAERADHIEERLEEGHMKNQACLSCVANEWLRRQMETEATRIHFVCGKCPDVRRFVLCGPVPKTRREADQLIADLKKGWGLTDAPGPKKKETTWLDIWQAYQQLSPDAKIEHLAEAVGASVRKIQEILKKVHCTLCARSPYAKFLRFLTH